MRATVAAIRSVERRMKANRGEMRDLAARRSELVRRLLGGVGADEAARLLGLSKPSIYRNARGR
jgi:hypothetical protein